MSAAANSPEQEARVEIDAQLKASGWVVQDRKEIDLPAGQGVAIREFKLKQGHGYADSPAGLGVALPESPRRYNGHEVRRAA